MGFDVLVVDDEADICTILSAHLGSMGLDVKTASDGIVACEIIQQVQPAPGWLLMTDLDMPRMNGLSLIQNAIDNDWNCGRIILATGADRWEQRYVQATELLKKFGRPFRVLRKPFNPEELDEAVREASHTRAELVAPL